MALVKGAPAAPLQGPEVHISSVLPPPIHWILNCKTPPKFLLYLYLVLAALRSHDTMTTINLDSVKFYHPLSMAGMTDKNPMVTLQHKGETAEDTQDGVAGM